MSSLIRTIRRALKRQAVEPGTGRSPAGKPQAKRQRRKGGRSPAEYRATQRRAAVTAARKQRKLIRAALKARPLTVELPRIDDKNRRRECARRLRQMQKAAA